MRVPLYVADLRYKRGFNRIAKKLQKNWPGASPLRLDCSHEILLRGFGYRDFYDLQQSAQKGEINTYVPSQTDARDGISTSIFAFCKSRKVSGISDDDIERLVRMLPLQELAIFQNPNSDRAANQTLDFPGRSVTQNEVALPDAVHEVVSKELEQENLGYSGIRRSVALESLISKDDLKLIWEAVQRRGSLRDQCMLLILLQGVRATEARGVRPRDISHFKQRTTMRLNRSKTPGHTHDIFLPESFFPLMNRYIKRAKISPDGLLFPSKRDVKLPMTYQEMSRVVGSYLREVLPDPSQRSVHKIRLSVAMQICKSSGMTLEQMMRHTNHGMTFKYLNYPLAPETKPEE